MLKENKASRPFSQDHVLGETKRHISDRISISIRKTLERIAEFDGNQQMSLEVFRTISALHMLQKQVDEFQPGRLDTAA